MIGASTTSLASAPPPPLEGPRTGAATALGCLAVLAALAPRYPALAAALVPIAFSLHAPNATVLLELLREHLPGAPIPRYPPARLLEPDAPADDYPPAQRV